MKKGMQRTIYWRVWFPRKRAGDSNMIFGQTVTGLSLARYAKFLLDWHDATEVEVTYDREWAP